MGGIMRTRSPSTVNAFWAGESCEYCGGKIRGRIVELTRRYAGRWSLFRNVPAGVCTECGTRYFAGNVLKLIDDRLRRREAPDERRDLAVYD